MSYVDVCKEVLALFVSTEEIPRHDLDALVEKSFSDFARTNAEVVPMIRISENTWFMEMFHGPTGAFKVDKRLEAMV
jgi:threonine synthase